MNESFKQKGAKKMTRRLIIFDSVRKNNNVYHTDTVQVSTLGQKTIFNKAALTSIAIIDGKSVEISSTSTRQAARWIGPIPNSISGRNYNPAWGNIIAKIESEEVFDTISKLPLCIILENEKPVWYLGAPTGERSKACIKIGCDALKSEHHSIKKLRKLGLFKFEAKIALESIK